MSNKRVRRDTTIAYRIAGFAGARTVARRHRRRTGRSSQERPDEAFERSIAETVPRILEGVEDARIVNRWAGFDAATPDARPLIGPVPDGPAGLSVAIGFNGLGIRIGAVTGPTVRESLGGPSAPFSTEAFSPTRFDQKGELFELRSTADK